METKVVKSKREDSLQAVWFAAGIAALMACLKRAALESFVEQWRVWVFLALNLLLLAILFTSTTNTSSSSSSSSSSSVNDSTSSSTPSSSEANQENKSNVEQRVSGMKSISEKSEMLRSEYEEKDEVEIVEEDDTKTDSVSKEELNERVEAFIAMFRQHLASDAKGQSSLHSSPELRRHFTRTRSTF